MKKALIIASVSSMIQQFNIPNIELLINMGYEVHVACNFLESGTITIEKSLELKDKLNSMNVVSHQIDFDRNPFKITKLSKSFSQLSKIMKQDFSLVHSHSPVGGAIGRITANKYRKKGLKSIYTAHGFHFFKGSSIFNWLTYYPIEKLLSTITDVLITINKEDTELATSKFHSAKTIYVPGIGIDDSKFLPVPEHTKNKFRKELGFFKDYFILIYVGELSQRKNQSMLLQVVETLKPKIPKLKLLLVGKGPLELTYKDIIEEKDLGSIVHLMGYRNDISKLMAISDIAVSTSKQEGLPVNVMEAMATGLPLVVTNSRGNNDLVTEENGYLVELNNTQQFSDEILKLYNDNQKSLNMGNKSREIVTKYSLSKVISIFKNIYGDNYE